MKSQHAERVTEPGHMEAFGMGTVQNSNDQPEPNDHFVQLYSDDNILEASVGRYLLDGLAQGDPGIVIATPTHRLAFQSYLNAHGTDFASCERAGQLLFLDAERTLSHFMVDGRPDWNRFQGDISTALASVRRNDGGRVRAYGEMVGVLWTAGAYSAAIQLEEHWNRLLAPLPVTLFCAYPIDLFGPEFQAQSVHAILCDHSRLVAEDDSGRLESAVIDAMRQVVGEPAPVLISRMKLECPPQWGEVPSAERLILWVRANFPCAAGNILQLARERYLSTPCVCSVH